MHSELSPPPPRMHLSGQQNLEAENIVQATSVKPEQGDSEKYNNIQEKKKTVVERDYLWVKKYCPQTWEVEAAAQVLI